MAYGVVDPTGNGNGAGGWPWKSMASRAKPASGGAKYEIITSFPGTGRPPIVERHGDWSRTASKATPAGTVSQKRVRVFDPTGNGFMPSRKVMVPGPAAPAHIAAPYYVGAGRKLSARIEPAADSSVFEELTSEPGVLSRSFRNVAPGTVALSAHGSSSILSLVPGDPVTILCDGPALRYVVKTIYSLECLADPTKSTRWAYEHHAQYKSLAHGSIHSVTDLHQFFYEQPGERVVFSTCIAAADGTNPAWGRRFVVAEPA